MMGREVCKNCWTTMGRLMSECIPARMSFPHVFCSCPLDKGLFGPIEYKSDLEAIQRGNAFKFADRPTVYFRSIIYN